MKKDMRRVLILIIFIIILFLMPVASMVFRYIRSEKEVNDRIQRGIQKNMELWETRSGPNPGISYERAIRELSSNYENFTVYMWSIPDSDSLPEDVDWEIRNKRTGKMLLRGPMTVYPQNMEKDIRCDNNFYEYDSDTLLWVQNYGHDRNPSLCYLVDTDGNLTPVECSAHIVGCAGRHRFMIDGEDQTHSVLGKDGIRYPGLAYGVLDHDLKTVLLPAEYGGPSLDSGGMYYPSFSEGYMFAQKNDKFGVIGYDLQEKIPFVYHKLIIPHCAQICSYGNGVLFLESGIEVNGVHYQTSGIHTMFVNVSAARKITEYRLIDRTGKVLYTLPYNEADILSYDENDHPLLNGEPLDIPELTNKSDWAAPIIDNARTAGLIPAELDQMYRYNATRRDFCMLAVQLVRTLRPGLCETAVQNKEAVFWDCDDTDVPMEDINLAAQLGIVKGEGAFEPFLPITRQDAAEILMHTEQLSGIKAATDEGNTDAFDLETKNSDNAASDSIDGCTIEQSISVFWKLYQSAKG